MRQKVFGRLRPQDEQDSVNTGNRTNKNHLVKLVHMHRRPAPYCVWSTTMTVADRFNGRRTSARYTASAPHPCCRCRRRDPQHTTRSRPPLDLSKRGYRAKQWTVCTSSRAPQAGPEAASACDILSRKQFSISCCLFCVHAPPQKASAGILRQAICRQIRYYAIKYIYCSRLRGLRQQKYFFFSAQLSISMAKLSITPTVRPRMASSRPAHLSQLS